jgi:hypothetical protein
MFLRHVSQRINFSRSWHKIAGSWNDLCVSDYEIYKACIYVNASVTARVEITGIDENKKKLSLATTCNKEKGELVLQGEAVVIPTEWLI